jgi:2-(3-amino-3-carboxypropyl)histidine synthase
MELNLDINGLVKEIVTTEVKKIVLQVPEGLKTQAQTIISSLDKFGIQTYLSIEPVYGACDLATNFMDTVKADAIVHIGHTEFLNSKKKVIYWPCYYEATKEEISKLSKNIDSELANKRITFVGPIQYKKVIELLEKEVKNVIIVKTKSSGLLQAGQILGCDTSILSPMLKEIDAVVYIGDGAFHISAITQNIQIYTLGGLDVVLYEQKDDLKKKIMNEYIFKEAKNVGILVTSKIGQNNYKVAEKIYEELKKQGKSPYLLIADFISYDKILGLKLDCLINTACPRLVDDKENYKIPLINYKDILKFI